MLTSFVRKARARVASLSFLARFGFAVLRDRPIRIPHIQRGPAAHLTPQGRFLPAIAGGDGTDDPPKPEPTPTPTPTPPAPSDKTFTQSDVDRIVQDRLARDREQYKDYDELKDKASKYDESEAANQSALEKAQGEATKQKEAAEEATRKLQEQEQTSRENLRQSKIETAAIKAGATDPSDIHALLSARGFKVTTKVDDKDTELAVTIGDDGQVTGVEEVVKAFLEEKPNLVGNTPPPPGDGGARNPVPPKDLQAQIKEAEEKGEYPKAMALKQQQLAEMRDQQQPGGKPAGGGQ